MYPNGVRSPRCPAQYRSPCRDSSPLFQRAFAFPTNGAIPADAATNSPPSRPRELTDGFNSLEGEDMYSWHQDRERLQRTLARQDARKGAASPLSSREASRCVSPYYFGSPVPTRKCSPGSTPVRTHRRSRSDPLEVTGPALLASAVQAGLRAHMGDCPLKEASRSWREDRDRLLRALARRDARYGARSPLSSQVTSRCTSPEPSQFSSP